MFYKDLWIQFLKFLTVDVHLLNILWNFEMRKCNVDIFHFNLSVPVVLEFYYLQYINKIVQTWSRSFDYWVIFYWSNVIVFSKLGLISFAALLVLQIGGQRSDRFSSVHLCPMTEENWLKQKFQSKWRMLSFSLWLLLSMSRIVHSIKYLLGRNGNYHISNGNESFNELSLHCIDLSWFGTIFLKWFYILYFPVAQEFFLIVLQKYHITNDVVAKQIYGELISLFSVNICCFYLLNYALTSLEIWRFVIILLQSKASYLDFAFLFHLLEVIVNVNCNLENHWNILCSVAEVRTLSPR